MAGKLDSRTSIVFFGLDEPLATELSTALRGAALVLLSKPLASVSQCRQAIDDLDADLAFCPAEGKSYRILLEAVRESRRGLPVVVVSWRAEVAEWLDALEDGATDYCAAPFEAAQIRWILDSCLQPKRAVFHSG